MVGLCQKDGPRLFTYFRGGARPASNRTKPFELGPCKDVAWISAV